MNDQVVEILPNLWLSGYKYALNDKFLIEKKIKVVINCSKNIKFSNLKHIQKIRISVDDSLKIEDIDKLESYFPKIVEIIHTKMNNLEPILVHCYAGKQRSASVISAYLMKYGKLKYLESIVFIQSKKKNAFKPGINFSQALIKYQDEISDETA